MDRQVSSDILEKRKWKNRLWVVMGIALLAVGIYFFRYSIQTSLQSSDIQVVTVEKGDIENTITATGEVIPAFEQVITSPIQAEIKSLLIPVGSTVQPNQAILELNKEFALIQKGKLEDELSLKQNNIVKSELQLEKNIFDLKINNQIKDLRINDLHADLENEKKLNKIGGGTQESVEKVELQLQIAQLEKVQLQNDLDFKQKTVHSDLRTLQLQASIQEKNLQEFQTKLNKANITANRKGVLTWVNQNIGSKVTEGEVLARVADLGSFRIEGSISDVYSEKVIVGQSVIVRINDHDLRGTIKSIKPTVENDIIKFDIRLKEQNHELLRPNLKVEVFIITKSKNGILRVANGPTFNGRKQQYIYILNEGVAVRKTVDIGLTNFDYVEVKNHLEPGDQIIISDMKNYEHLAEIQISDLISKK